MSLREFKFLESLTSQMITPVFNSVLSAGDKITDLFAKVQALLLESNLRTVLTAAWSGGASTTADQTILTLVVPAGQLQVGDIIEYQLRGVWTKPYQAGTYIQVWVKVNGTRTGDVQYTPTGGVTARPFALKGFLTVRSVGSTGVILGSGDAQFMTNATTTVTMVANGGAVTTDTTATVTITMGIVFSNSNASNNVTANIGFIKQS